MIKHKARGFTLIESFIALAIFTLMLSAVVPGVKAFFTRMAVTNGLRSVTCAFNSARYLSVGMNKRVKISLSGRRFLLMEMKNRKWVEFKYFELDEDVIVTMNASPVFSPYGDVAPLCTVTIQCGTYRYKITISMAGRLLVTQL